MTPAPRRRGRKKAEPLELAVSATCRLTFRSKDHAVTLRLEPLETTLKPESLRSRRQLLEDLNRALRLWIAREVETNVRLAQRKQDPS